MKIILRFLSLALLGVFVSGSSNAQSTVTFNCTGAAQSWVVPPCVFSITVTAEGAEGGGGSLGGNGAVVTATLPVTPGQTVVIEVGCSGTSAGGASSGGFGGGGQGFASTDGNTSYNSSGGGGASTISIGGIDYIIAAGGGGAGGGSGIVGGGAGGCLSGSSGTSTYGTGATGGTQTAGGTGGTPWAGTPPGGSNGGFGFGGMGGFWGTASGGGGGGGYYGGGGGGNDGCCTGANGGGGGGGGSSLTPVGGTCTAGLNTGPGVVTISYGVGGGSTTASNTGPYCAGQTIQLNTGAGVSYSWTGPGGFTSTAQNPTIPSSTAAMSGVYSVTTTYSGGCSATSSTTVTVNAVPATTVNSPTTCNGSSATLTASGATTYAWSTGATTSSITVAPATTTTYTVTGTSAGCSATAVSTVTAVLSPAPSPTNSGPVCSGTTLNLFGPTIAGATYSWTGPGGFTSTLQNPSIASVTAANAGNYSLTVTVSGCTSPAGTTNVVVINTPAPPIPNNNGPLCEGASLALTANNIAGATYAWTGPAGFTAAVRNPPPFTATVAASGTYTLTVTVGGCTSAPAFTTVVINPMPVAPTAPPVSVCYNTAATLTASVSGPTYEWFDLPTGGTLLGTGATYTTPLLTSSTTYYVHSTSAGCTGPMTAVPVTVTASFTVDAGADDSICSGASSTLNVVTPTSGGYTYTWNPGGLSGSSVTVSPATTTTYTLDVVDGIGCTGSDMVTVHVGAPLVATASGNPATCVSSCDGSADVIITGGFAPYTYSWSSGATTSTISGLCAGTYTVDVTDAIGCTIQDTVVIVAPTALATVMSSITSHCDLPDGSASVTASGGVGGYSYLWSPGGQTTATAINLVPGSYCVTVTDANGCTITTCVTVPNTPGVNASLSAQTNTTCNGICDGSATVSTAGGIAPYTFSWNTVPVQTTATASALCAGSYICTVTDSSGCTDTVMVTITQPAPVAVDAVPPVTICIGQSATLNASAMGGTSPYTYTWSAPAFTGAAYTVNPTTTTTYTVSATDDAGCASINTQTVTVTVRPPLSVVASNDVSICPGSGTTISAMGSGGNSASYTYTWMPGGMTGSGQNVSPSVTTTYTVTLSDGCTTLNATDVVTVTVLPLPAVMFNSDLITGCTPLTVNFTDLTNVVGGSIDTWFWNFGAAGTSSLQNPSATYTVAGTYDVTLTVTTDSGCVNFFTINDMITVNALPEANFVFDPQPATIAAPMISFHDLSTDATGWYWNFGDSISGINNFSNMMNPTHSYSDTGTFCVTLIVTNTTMCADTTQDCLVINPEFTFWIPNSFSPNGDGLNDVFMPKGEHIKEFTMRIYDRWGELTYFTSDMYKGWNGAKMNLGEIAQQDVYVYVITVKDKVGENHQYIGHVTIIK